MTGAKLLRSSILHNSHLNISRVLLALSEYGLALVFLQNATESSFPVARRSEAEIPLQRGCRELQLLL